jgi:hypothetical protein
MDTLYISAIATVAGTHLYYVIVSLVIALEISK